MAKRFNGSGPGSVNVTVEPFSEADGAEGAAKNQDSVEATVESSGPAEAGRGGPSLGQRGPDSDGGTRQ